MVIKHYISIFFLILTITCFADAYNIDFHEGVSAFKKKDYSIAVDHFNNEIEKNPNNVSAFFNLGLSYNAQKEYGKAIWAFEKVLKLTPNNAEAIDNIEQNYLELDNGSRWTSQLSHFDRTLYGMTSNTWALVSVFLSILCALFIILLRKTESLSRKRAFLAGTFVLALLMVFSIYTASGAYSFENSHNYALVTKDKVETFANGNVSRSEKTEVTLEAGTKVKKTGMYKGGILEVETMDGQTHFVNTGEVDFI